MLSSPWLKGKNKIAEYFSTNRFTIDSWIKKGLPCHRRGKWMYFHLVEVDKWMMEKDSGVN